jgi:hypothetical protein
VPRYMTQDEWVARTRVVERMGRKNYDLLVATRDELSATVRKLNRALAYTDARNNELEDIDA